MQILHTIAEMRRARTLLRASPETLGLVPTMGALHEGHLSLVRAARATCQRVAVSIFVNPTQFAPGEDFAAYPRTWQADVDLLRREGVDMVFAPSAAEMYPGGSETYVDTGAVGTRLDGASRPGHFRGVTTVVAKLFHIVEPDRAFFGQKDAAQVAVLRTMVRDLNVPVEVVVCPTVRDADGLALSSRNRYLSAEERGHALALSRSLRLVESLVRDGTGTVETVRSAWQASLLAEPGLRVDYTALVDPATLLPVENFHGDTLAAVAASIGTTRLIDNVVLRPVSAQPR